MATVNLPNTCLLNLGQVRPLYYFAPGIDYDVPDDIAEHPWLVAHQTEGSIAEQNMTRCPDWATEAPRQGVQLSPTVAVLTGGGHTNLLNFRDVADGAFAITINGEAQEVGPMDFSKASSGMEVAAAVDAALGGATCQYVSANYVLSTAPAPGAEISFASPPAAGTDVSTMLGLTAAQGAIITPGALRAAEAASAPEVVFRSSHAPAPPPAASQAPAQGHPASTQASHANKSGGTTKAH